MWWIVINFGIKGGKGGNSVLKNVGGCAASPSSSAASPAGVAASPAAASPAAASPAAASPANVVACLVEDHLNQY